MGEAWQQQSVLPTRTGCEMRPAHPSDSGFTHNGLAKAFTYAPVEGPLAGWKIEGRYDLVGARLTITELLVATEGTEVPENGITGSLLRHIHPAALADMIRRKEQGWLDWLQEGLAEVDHEATDPKDLRVARRLIKDAQDLVAAPRSGPTGVRGRPPLDAEFLREVAQMHAEEVAFDGKYGAIQRLADQLGVPYNTAKDWIAKAKARDLYNPEAPSEDA